MIMCRRCECRRSEFVGEMGEFNFVGEMGCRTCGMSEMWVVGGAILSEIRTVEGIECRRNEYCTKRKRDVGHANCRRSGLLEM